MKASALLFPILVALLLIIPARNFELAARTKSADGSLSPVPPIARRCIVLQEPVDDGEVSSGFGARRHLGEAARRHEGVDYAARVGTPVSVAADGQVVQIGWNRTYGRFIKVGHGGKLTTMYAHLNRASKSLLHGSKVLRGDVIGYVGRTGRVTGANLHFEVRKNDEPLDPVKFLNDDRMGDTLDCGGSSA